MNEHKQHTKEGHVDLSEEEVILEKKDSLALILAGFLTVGLPCFILILIIIGAVLLIFTRC
ncbi:MAG: hypothetical protein IIZ55_04045 [Firmicutes bacterium]|nr:hypothetical protein [Bacillota bacterium]